MKSGPPVIHRNTVNLEMACGNVAQQSMSTYRSNDSVVSLSLWSSVFPQNTHTHTQFSEGEKNREGILMEFEKQIFLT